MPRMETREGNLSAEERRGQTDRRKRPTTLLSALRFRGRRHSFRRAREGCNSYVDRPSYTTVVTACCVVVASILDAYFTLLHLSSGAAEANPVMALALDHSLGFFIGSKLGVTAFGAWFLAAHQNFTLGIKALQFLLFTYVLLLSYHVALFLV